MTEIKPNIFTGAREKQIGFKISKASKIEIEERAKKLGFTNTTDYILTLIDRDLKEGAERE